MQIYGRERERERNDSLVPTMKAIIGARKLFRAMTSVVGMRIMLHTETILSPRTKDRDESETVSAHETINRKE